MKKEDKNSQEYIEIIFKGLEKVPAVSQQNKPSQYLMTGGGAIGKESKSPKSRKKSWVFLIK